MMATFQRSKRLFGASIATFAALALAVPAMAAPGANNESEEDLTSPETSGLVQPMNEVVGFITQDYGAGFLDGGPDGQRVEGTVMTLIADAMQASLNDRQDTIPTVDLVMFEPKYVQSGLRFNANHPAGPGAVTRADIQQVFRYPGEAIAIVQLTGAEIAEVLNYQYPQNQYSLRWGINSRLSYTYEVQLTYDPDQGVVYDHSNIIQLIDLRFDGGEISRDQIFHVAVPHAMTGPSGPPIISEAPTVMPLVDLKWTLALEELLAKFYPNPFPYHPWQRSIGFLRTPGAPALLTPEGVIEQGAPATVTATSLLFGSNDHTPDSSVLHAFVNGSPVGRYHINAAAHMRQDNHGVALVRFVMPDGIPGYYRIVFRIDDVDILDRVQYVSAHTSYYEFNDVPAGVPFGGDIYWASFANVAKGWHNGDGTYRFQRYSPVLRDQMAAFIHRLGKLAGEYANQYTPPPESPFKDVPTDHVFYREICWMFEEEISTGWVLPDGTREFRPYEPVRRDQMAAFLYRFGVKRYPAFANWPTPAVSGFADIKPSRIFNREIQWMKAFDVATGWQVGNDWYYRPYNIVLRDQMAAFLKRAYDLVVAYPGDLPVEF